MTANPGWTRCKARSTTSGEQCKKPATPGAAVCASHGSRAPQVRAAARRRVEADAARAQLVALGEPVDVDPATALLGLVHAKAGEVAWLREKVREVAAAREGQGDEPVAADDQRLVWGITRTKTGGDDAGTTEESKPNVWWVLLRQAEDQLADYATRALKAGIEERRVRLAEDQGLLVAQVMRAVLGEMYDATILALRALGLSSDEISDAMRQAWEKATQVVVPRELRRLEGGSPS